MNETAISEAAPVTDEERRQLARVRADLEHEFADRLTADEVARRFDEAVAAFDDAPIRSFVPVLAQRSVRSQLRRTTAGLNAGS